MKKNLKNSHFIDECEDFLVAGITNSGIVKQNMDYILHTMHPKFPNVNLLVVADGLSAAQNGLGSGFLFCNYLEREFNKLSESDLEDAERALQDIVYMANKMLEIFNVANDAECYAAGAVALVIDNNVYCISVGDVRVYCVQGGNLINLTEENTEQRFLGYNDKTRPHFLKSEVKKNVRRYEDVYSMENIDSVFLMCDGVASHVSETCKCEIIDFLDARDVPRALVEVAQYGHTTSVDMASIIETEDLDTSNDNLSVLGYFRKARKLTHD